MSYTFLCSDGDLDINKDTGRLTLIKDEVKLSQDLAEVLMNDLDVDRDYGSELNTITGTVGTTPVTNAFVSQAVAEAVSRLQSYQRLDANLTPSENIIGISDLNVVRDPSAVSTVYFYVAVQNGVNEVVEQIMNITKPTQLNHQLSAAVTQEVRAENIETIFDETQRN